MADVARSGPLLVPAGKVLEDMRASAKTARREMKESSAPEEDGATIIDALDYVLYQVRKSSRVFPPDCTEWGEGGGEGASFLYGKVFFHSPERQLLVAN